MTFKDIERVNSEMKMTDIKGKAYAEVPQRIQAFRKLYPEGFIKTELVSLSDGVCIIKASVGVYDVTDNHETVFGTGYAYEREGSTFINQTSYIENCETSAVGRALGMIGIGSETSIASAEEVQNAIKQQEDIKEKAEAKKKAEQEGKKKLTPVMLKSVRNSIEKHGYKEEKLLAYFKIQKLEDMTVAQMRQFNDMINKEDSKK